MVSEKPAAGSEAPTRELLAPAGAVVPGVRARDAVLLIAGCAGLATAFYSVLLFGGSLHGYDWASHHFNYFDWVRESLVEHSTLPLFMNDAWITKNFLANAEAPSLGPLVALLFVLPTGAYLKLLIVLHTAAGLAGVMALLRDVGVRPDVAAIAAVTFAFGGFFVSHICVGHPWAMGGLLLPGLLWLYRRAALGSFAALCVAAAVNAFTILGGQHQPFIWQNLVLGAFGLAWAIKRRAAFPLGCLAQLGLITLGLGAVKLLPMVAEFADYDPSARVVGLPLGAIYASLVGRGQGPEYAVSQIAFEHGAGWWEYAFYLGPIGAAFLIVGVLAARRGFSLLAIGAGFLWLSVDWPSSLSLLDVWTWLQDWPVWRTQRGPSRFLVLALFCFTLVAALGVERLRERFSLARPAALWVLAALLCVDLFGQSLAWQTAAIGAPLAGGDHRPKPLRVVGTHGAVAELVDFAPNRLVYRASAERESRVRFPFRLGEGTREWRVAGLPAVTDRGKLAVELPPGQRDVVMVYRPAWFFAGAGTTAATLTLLGTFAAWRKRTAT